jgi:hypothetical protein
MPLKNQAITVCYLAWNTSTNAGQTGDSGNHTLKLIQDGSENNPTNSPAQVDATNCPGLYSLALAAGDMNFNCVVLHGKSSTANVVIVPQTFVTDRGVLPTVAPAASGGFITVGTSSGQINPDGTGRVLVAGPVKKNVAITSFTFFMVSSSDHTTPATGLSVRVQVSLDGAAFANSVNTPATEIGGGWYKITLAAGDVNGNVVAVQCSAAGADTVAMTFLTQS